MDLDIDIIKNIVTPLAKKYGVTRMFLFGSYARGDHGLDSDIDIRIDKGEVRGLQMAALLLDLEDALHKPVDLLSTSALDPDFLNTISSEEKLIYESAE